MKTTLLYFITLQLLLSANYLHSQLNWWGDYYVMYGFSESNDIDTVGVLKLDSTMRYSFEYMNTEVDSYSSKCILSFLCDTTGEFELNYIDKDRYIIVFDYIKKDSSFREDFRYNFGLRRNSSTYYINYLGSRLGKWTFVKTEY